MEQRQHQWWKPQWAVLPQIHQLQENHQVQSLLWQSFYWCFDDPWISLLAVPASAQHSFDIEKVQYMEEATSSINYAAKSQQDKALVATKIPNHSKL